MIWAMHIVYIYEKVYISADKKKKWDVLQECEGASSNKFKQFLMILYYIEPFSCYI